MSGSLKTTLYLDAVDYRRLQALARKRDVKTASMVREAVRQYLDRQDPTEAPRTFGSVDFGTDDLSERVDEHLAGLGEDPEQL